MIAALNSVATLRPETITLARSASRIALSIRVLMRSLFITRSQTARSSSRLLVLMTSSARRSLLSSAGRLELTPRVAMSSMAR